MRRSLPRAAAFLAVPVGAYQLWFASRHWQIASIYSTGIGFLVQGHSHYPMTFHNFYLWLYGEAALSILGGLALIVGAVLIVRRSAAGAWWIVGGCAVVVAHTAVGWVVASKMVRWFAYVGADDYGLLWFNSPNRLVVVGVSFALPATAAALALTSGARPRERIAKPS
ncbi:hypothetical protein [Mycobacterium sp. 050134]|uniref:hypothetical protein n=1 Tax=Mycobacterium sp. 050134 TaxID=3096111 RepID=UPI002ED9C105